MRVLHLIPSLLAGGAERQLSLLAPAQRRQGLDVHVAFQCQGPFLAALQDTGVGLHHLPVLGSHPLHLVRALWRTVAHLKPDLIQTWLTRMDILGGGIARLQHVPHVMTERSAAAAYPPNASQRWRRWAGRSADALVANSQGGVAYWAPHCAPGKLHLVANAVAPEFFRAPKAAGVEPAEPLILFAGRLSPEKNVELLIEAMIDAAALQPHWRFRLIGDGPLRPTLLARIASSGLTSCIEVLGASPGLAAHFQAATLFVSLSHFEGHPNVVCEAAASGCPVLLSDIPAHRQLLNENSAWFVTPTNASAVVAAMQAAIGQPERRVELARRAAQLAQAWAVDPMAQAYSRIYTQALRPATSGQGAS